jgi:hypothetical protein
LVNLPEIFENAGLDVTVYPGWETRSRSSGGYDALLGIGIHHDASGINSSDQSAWDWAWKNSADRPIGAIRISRGTGLVCVGAAGATNTMGKGGPLTVSGGTIPLDAGNKYMIAIEAGNNGLGEAWSTKMVDAYIRVLAALCDAFDFDPSRDIFTHHSYCAPSCPGRKVDPAGPTPSQPSLGGTSGNKIWSHDDVRHLVMVEMGKPPPPPTPSGEGVPMFSIAGKQSNDGPWRIGDGRNAIWCGSDVADAQLAVNMRFGGMIDAKTRNKVTSWSQVGVMSAADLDRICGQLD